MNQIWNKNFTNSYASMRWHMKKLLDKLKNNVKVNKKLFFFLLCLMIVGIIGGSIFATILSANDKQLVTDHLSNYFNQISTQTLNYLGALKNSLIYNIIFVVIIWLLGISVIGLPVMVFMFFTKGFSLGFSIASILVNYKLKGCLLSFGYIFPHQIINMLLFSFLMVYSIALSLKIGKALVQKKTLDFGAIMSKYGIVLAVVIGGVVLTSLIEVFITPNLLKVILPLIK